MGEALPLWPEGGSQTDWSCEAVCGGPTPKLAVALKGCGGPPGTPSRQFGPTTGVGPHGPPQPLLQGITAEIWREHQRLHLEEDGDLPSGLPSLPKSEAAPEEEGIHDDTGWTVDANVERQSA